MSVDTIPFSPVGLDHVVIRAGDAAALVEFYGRVLGLPVERHLERIGLYQLRAGRTLIDIVDAAGEIGRGGGAAPGAEGRNMDHYCIRIEPWDEAAIRGHLETHGVDAGPAERRYGAEGDGPSIYLSDPEGNVVELKGPPDNT